MHRQRNEMQAQECRGLDCVGASDLLCLNRCDSAAHEGSTVEYGYTLEYAPYTHLELCESVFKNH